MRRQPSKNKRAFTLIELIIVIAIIAILIALLLPAIQAARAAAMKNSGRNNMKQLALSCQNHNDTYKTFPPLYFCNIPDEKGKLKVAEATVQYTWLVRLLPFMEEDTMYKSISATSLKFTTDSTKVQIPGPQGQMVAPGTLVIAQFLAPNQQGSAPGTTNYVALSATRQPLLTNYEGDVAGQQTTKTPPDGMIIPDKQGRGQSMARMADGTSKTAIICESREQEKSNWYVPQQVFVCGFLPEDTVATDENKTQFYPYFNNGEWVPVPNNDRTALNYGPARPGKAANPLANPNGVKQAYNGDPKDPLARTWGPSSMNMGGIVIHGMGDGSVQEVADQQIEPKVYFAAITTRGGENVQGLWDR